MTASGWRKLALAVFIAVVCVRAWMMHYYPHSTWTTDFSTSGISSNDNDSSSSSSTSSSDDDDDDSGGASASADDD